MNKMKYRKEYEIARSKDEFINAVLRDYKVKKSTAVRRYYDLKKKLGGARKIVLGRTDDSLIIPVKPNYFRLLMFDDMKRHIHYDIISHLRQYGFKPGEIKWLKENKKL